MHVPQMNTFLNRWFTSYQEARASLEQEGGFLLPFQGQYFITTGHAIRELGLDPEDADWALIGWDWVQPKNSEAFIRLLKKREHSMHVSNAR